MSQLFSYETWSEKAPASKEVLDNLNPKQVLALQDLLMRFERACVDETYRVLSKAVIAGDIHCTDAIKVAAKAAMCKEIAEFLVEIRENSRRRTAVVDERVEQ